MSREGTLWARFLFKINELRQKKFVKAICLTGVYFLVFLLVFQPFLGIDDVTYVERLYGIYGQDYSFYNSWVRWLYLAFILQLIHLFPAIPWYTLVFHILYFATMVLVTYAILEWYDGKIGLLLANVVLLFFSYEGFIAIIFTKIACIMGVAGMIIAVAPNVKKRMRLTGIFLFFVATLIRIDSGPMALAFGIFVVMVAMLEFCLHDRTKVGAKKVTVSVLFFAIGILVYKFSANSNALLFSNSDAYSEYMEFYQMNGFRSGIQDYQIPQTDEMKEFYEKEGISDNDLYIWHNWNYDWNLISPEISQKIINGQKRTTSLWSRVFDVNNIFKFFKHFPLKLLNIDVYIALIIIFFVLFLCASQQRVVILGGIISNAYMLLLNYFLYVNGRFLQHRVDVGIVMGTILLMLILARGRQYKINKKQIIPLMVIITLCGNYLKFQDDLPPVSETKMADNKALFKMTQGDMEHCYVVCNDSEGRYFITSVEAYDTLEVGSRRNVIAVNYYEPMIKSNLKKYSLVNPYLDCLDRNDIYLMFRGDNDDQEKWEKYITKHTGKDTKLELVKEYYGVKLYKAHSKEIDEILDFSNSKEGDIVIDGLEINSTKDDKISVSGNAHLQGTQGYNENVYLEAYDNRTGEVRYLYTTQTIDHTLETTDEGYYSHFETTVDISEEMLEGISLYVIIEDEGQLYRQVCMEF